jgi:hypothetical protein
VHSWEVLAVAAHNVIATFITAFLQIARWQFLSWKCGWLVVHLYVKSSQLLVSCSDEIDAGILICFS